MVRKRRALFAGGRARRAPFLGPRDEHTANEVCVKNLLAGCALAGLLVITPYSRAVAQEPAAPPPAQAPEGEEGSQVPDFDYTKISPPPPLPKVVDVRQPGESGLWIGGALLFGQGQPTFDRGDANFNNFPAKLKMLGTPKFGQGFEVGLAVSHHDSLRFTYYTIQASGGGTVDEHVQPWTELYPGGNFVDRNYRLKTFRLSLDYLTWPNPVKTSKFRLKTLWQLQYTHIRTGFDAPHASLYDSTGNLQYDASGHIVTFDTEGTVDSWIPMVGAAVQYWPAKRVRLEAGGSGFAMLHRSGTWDADAGAALRIGVYELRVGMKAFHYRTTPRAEFWVHGTAIGPYIGLRLYSK